MNEKWTIKEIIKHAKEHSLFYKKHFQNVHSEKLEDYPIVDQFEFWSSKVLTTDSHEGIVFKSGGSTGAPKYSYFTALEWKTFTDVFGWGMAQGILSDQDRVANLFYVGDLYASFLFIKDSLAGIPVEQKKIQQFPIAGATDSEQILKTIEEFSINALVGVPSALLILLEFFEKNRESFKKIKIEKLLFGGESLYPDQEEAIRKIFPHIQISSIGYASVDAGLLGFSDLSCGKGEHRVFDGANIIEIVDVDTEEVITEKNEVGKVLITNLTRKMMPIIRYPAGDLACWLEDAGSKNRKFKLQGRSEEAARLGTLSVYFEDTRLMISECLKEQSGLQFQMVLNHYDHKDELVFKIAGLRMFDHENIKASVLKSFIEQKRGYRELLQKKLIHPLKIEIVEMSELEGNTRTGKLKRVLDRR